MERFNRDKGEVMDHSMSIWQKKGDTFSLTHYLIPSRAVGAGGGM
jgi:hypothetical protein